MAPRVTPKDQEYVGKKLKAPDGFVKSGILTVRRIIIHGTVGKKYYLVRDDLDRPEFDDDDDYCSSTAPMRALVATQVCLGT